MVEARGRGELGRDTYTKMRSTQRSEARFLARQADRFIGANRFREIGLLRSQSPFWSGAFRLVVALRRSSWEGRW